MAVDVADLVDLLKSSVNPPGVDLFPDATEQDWVNNLRNGFWEANLDGLFTGYTEDDGSITPTSGTTEFPKNLQQMVVLYAGVTIVRNHLMNLDTVFRSKAGPVEFEVQKSAQLLKAVLDELVRKRQIILIQLQQSGTSTYYVDAALARNEALLYGDTHWIGY